MFIYIYIYISTGQYFILLLTGKKEKKSYLSFKFDF